MVFTISVLNVVIIDLDPYSSSLDNKFIYVHTYYISGQRIKTWHMVVEKLNFSSFISHDIFLPERQKVDRNRA